MKITKKSILYFFLISFKDILKPRIISVVVMPFLASFLFWGLLTYFFWAQISGLGLMLYNAAWMQTILTWFSDYFIISSDPFIWITSLAITLGVILPLAFISALLLTSIFLVPVIVEEIRKTDFPTLMKKSNSVFVGTTASISLSAKYFFSWVGTLPLWIILPGGSVIIPFLLLSWFNSMLFTWEVMIEVASKEETKIFIKKNKLELFGLGLLTSLLYFVPFLNFIAPVITAVCFSRFCLSRLNYEKN